MCSRCWLALHERRKRKNFIQIFLPRKIIVVYTHLMRKFGLRTQMRCIGRNFIKMLFMLLFVEPVLFSLAAFPLVAALAERAARDKTKTRKKKSRKFITKLIEIFNEIARWRIVFQLCQWIIHERFIKMLSRTSFHWATNLFMTKVVSITDFNVIKIEASGISSRDFSFSSYSEAELIFPPSIASIYMHSVFI